MSTPIFDDLMVERFAAELADIESLADCEVQR